MSRDNITLINNETMRESLSHIERTSHFDQDFQNGIPGSTPTTSNQNNWHEELPQLKQLKDDFQSYIQRNPQEIIAKEIINALQYYW